MAYDEAGFTNLYWMEESRTHDTSFVVTHA